MYDAVRVVVRLINIMQMLVFARVLMGWFLLPRALQPVYQFVFVVTEPLLMPFRKLSSKMGNGRMMFDLSPIMAMLSLQLAGMILTGIFLNRVLI